MRNTILVIFGTAALSVAQVPDCKLAAGWEQAGPARTFEGESLYEYMNGNSEGYLVYGFKKMHGVTCKKGGDTVKAERGPRFYEEIGKKGGETIKAERGTPFYEEIGRKGGQKVRELIERGKRT